MRKRGEAAQIYVFFSLNLDDRGYDFKQKQIDRQRERVGGKQWEEVGIGSLRSIRLGEAAQARIFFFVREG